MIHPVENASAISDHPMTRLKIARNFPTVLKSWKDERRRQRTTCEIFPSTRTVPVDLSSMSVIPNLRCGGVDTRTQGITCKRRLTLTRTVHTVHQKKALQWLIHRITMSLILMLKQQQRRAEDKEQRREATLLSRTVLTVDQPLLSWQTLWSE